MLLLSALGHAALHDAQVSTLLQNAVGMTRREADLVEHRHLRHSGTILGLAELEDTIDESAGEADSIACLIKIKKK